MTDSLHLMGFAAVALGIVLTPGPNMIYLISRSISQGRFAGFISLAGIVAGFIFYMVCAVLGLTSLLLTVPYAYDAIRIGGGLYLLWLAWKAVSHRDRSLLQTTDIPYDRPVKLFMMGFLTNLFNPKIAVMYLSLLPQFINPSQGNVLMQSLTLGVMQILISVAVNAAIVFSAGSIAVFLTKRQIWLTIQRWLMGTVLCVLAVRMLTDSKK